MLCYIYNSSIDGVNWLWLLSIFVGLWIWVVPATITDECTDGYLWSVFQTLTDNFTDGIHPSVCHTITDGINPSAYFKRETFFWRAISICKTISKCFFYFSDKYSDELWYYRRKESRRTYSVGEDVGK
jgi:hypothetical protein